MPTIDMVATGKRIKELRDNAGMSTRDIADVFGFQNQTAVFKWMKGTSLPLFAGSNPAGHCDIKGGYL